MNYRPDNYHEHYDPDLHPDLHGDDAPYTRSPWAPFIAFAVTLAAGGLIIGGIAAAMHVIRWATT